jgi:hypothetical protein
VIKRDYLYWKIEAAARHEKSANAPHIRLPLSATSTMLKTSTNTTVSLLSMQHIRCC